MSSIKLESVGTAVDENGMTHPINADGTLDLDEGMSGHVMDCDDEWYWNLSLVDGWSLLDFLDENLDMEAEIMSGYCEWKEKVNGLMGCQDTLSEVK